MGRCAAWTPTHASLYPRSRWPFDTPLTGLLRANGVSGRTTAAGEVPSGGVDEPGPPCAAGGDRTSAKANAAPSLDPPLRGYSGRTGVDGAEPRSGIRLLALPLGPFALN